MWRSPKLILIFWLVRLSALVSKMPLFVTIVTGDLCQAFVLPLQWPVAVLVILSQKIGCVKSNIWGGAWKSWTARAMITTTFVIASIVFIVFSRLVQNLGVLEALKRLKSTFLRLEKVLVGDLFFGAFVRLGRRSMAPRTVNIYFLDPGRKVEGGFGLRGNGFLNGLLPDVLLTAILLSPGRDWWPQTVAEQADQHWFWDHRVSIKFSEDGL